MGTHMVLGMQYALWPTPLGWGMTPWGPISSRGGAWGRGALYHINIIYIYIYRYYCLRMWACACATFFVVVSGIWYVVDVQNSHMLRFIIIRPICYLMASCGCWCTPLFMAWLFSLCCDHSISQARTYAGILDIHGSWLHTSCADKLLDGLLGNSSCCSTPSRATPWRVRDAWSCMPRATCHTAMFLGHPCMERC